MCEHTKDIQDEHQSWYLKSMVKGGIFQLMAHGSYVFICNDAKSEIGYIYNTIYKYLQKQIKNINVKGTIMIR